MIVVVQRVGIVVGVVEHGLNRGERRVVVGVARKADEHYKVIVKAMVEFFSVPDLGLAIVLLTRLTSGIIFLF